MKISTFVVILIISIQLSAQNKDSLDLLQDILQPISTETIENLYKPNYPDGIYLSKLDFLRKRPSSVALITPFKKNEIVEPDNDSIYLNCFFYHINTNKMIRNVFAVSFKGHLFFQIRSVLNNRNTKDRAQKADYPNLFARVIIGGDNYLYTETELSNLWASNIALFFGGIGDEIANEVTRNKGFVWDIKKQEFNIFKSCKDYNKFIENLYPLGIQACETQQPDLEFIRKAMNAIK
jgi:hypothetical protein